MGLEKPLETSRLKFIKSADTGELIAFVYRYAKSGELKGVREDFTGGKKICVLSRELKAAGTVRENTLYAVEMKAMNGGKRGYVVVSAAPILFNARIETTIIPKNTYQVSVTFGNKTVYFDPKNGRSPSSRLLEGVLQLLQSRQDIEDREQVVKEFEEQASVLIRRLVLDGFRYPPLR